MSSDLYRTRVVFDGHAGYAKSEEVQVTLHEAPQIPGLPKHVTEIDYAPQVRVADLRESAQARREMYAPEIAAIVRWLEAIVQAVRQQMEQRP